MQIKEIAKEQEILAIYDIFKENYQELAKKDFVKNITNLLKTKNYKLFSIVNNGSLEGAITFRIIDKIDSKRILQIDNFLIKREKDIFITGCQIVDFITKTAKSLQCDEIEISPTTKDFEIHKIFSQNKFVLEGFYFKKTL